MRRPLALVGLAGCSIIYSPNNIPAVAHDAAPDVLIDAPPDANGALLSIASMAPSSVYEGQGSGNSRPAVFVLTGSNFLSSATVSFDQPGLHAGAIHVSTDSTLLEVDVIVDVDPTKGHTVLAGDVTATVMQDGVMKSVTNPGMLDYLDEITATGSSALPFSSGSNVDTSQLTQQFYSQVDFTALSFSGTNRVAIRSISSLTCEDGFTAKGANGSGTTGGSAGPGAFKGANSGADGDGASGGHLGQGGTSSLLGGQGGAGGGGGFATNGGDGTGGNGPGTGGAMISDDWIADYSHDQVSGGGGGGGNSGLGAGNGGGGGGGGGVVELTAGGDLTCNKPIDVSGGAGAVSSTGGNGGGGAGGIIMLRAGGTLSANMPLTVAGGGGGTSSNTAGGNGSVGRIRWDSPNPADPGPGSASVTAVRGPAFIASTATVVQTMSFEMIGTPGRQVNIAVTDGGGHTASGPQAVQFSPGGTATFIAPLSPGYDHVCATIVGGTPGAPEADKCIDVAYLP